MYNFLRNLLSDKKSDVVFNCFGIWHILFIVLTFIVVVFFIVYLKNKTKEQQIKVIKIFINLAFILYMLDFFLMPFAYGQIDLEKLPFHICTVTCILCFMTRHNKYLAKYKKELAVLGLVGNIIYVFYPAGVGWYQIAPYSYRVIQTLVYHGVMSCYGILALRYEFELEFKKSYKELIIILWLVVWALLGNTLYNSDAKVFNWFFVVADPFNILPKDIAQMIMPFVMVFVIYFGVCLVYLMYYLIRKINHYFNFIKVKP